MTRREYFRDYYRKHKARPKQWRACLRCGKAVKGTARRLYCDDVCRALAARERKR